MAVGDEVRPVPATRGGYPDFWAGVVAAVTTGAPCPVDPDDAVLTIELIEAALHSARTGTTVSL